VTGSAAAGELVVVAALLEDRAARIEAVADLLAGRAAAAAWQGPAAERFRVTSADRRQQLRTAADGLRRAAQHARLVAANAP